ncbi:hypothetical protein BC829DRAFT_400778 [Chytridium lagenaria]|nr:hypothetical protein BC829DRAFT_400778 [Chytridium lagenaria]
MASASLWMSLRFKLLVCAPSAQVVAEPERSVRNTMHARYIFVGRLQRITMIVTCFLNLWSLQEHQSQGDLIKTLG